MRIVLPSTWEAFVQPRSEENGLCAIYMRPGDWVDQVEGSPVSWSDFPLSLRFSEHAFEKTASLAGFEKKGKSWIVHGRQGTPSPAKLLHGSGWIAVVGEPMIGFHNKESGFAGMENTFRAAIGPTFGMSAVLDLEAPNLKSEAMQILQSLRYVVPRKQ